MYTLSSQMPTHYSSVMSSCDTPADNRLFAQCGNQWLCCFPHEHNTIKYWSQVGEHIEAGGRFNVNMLSCRYRDSGGHLSIKMLSYQYRDSHVKDKTVSSLTWESPYLGKMIFILRGGPDYNDEMVMRLSSSGPGDLKHAFNEMYV